jgi:hypothetical protein
LFELLLNIEKVLLNPFCVIPRVKNNNPRNMDKANGRSKANVFWLALSKMLYSFFSSSFNDWFSSDIDIKPGNNS